MDKQFLGQRERKAWAKFRRAAAQSKTPRKIRSRLLCNEMTTDAGDRFCYSLKCICDTGRCLMWSDHKLSKKTKLNFTCQNSLQLFLKTTVQRRIKKGGASLCVAGRVIITPVSRGTLWTLRYRGEKQL